MVVSAAVTWWINSTSFLASRGERRSALTLPVLSHGHHELMSLRAYDHAGYAEPDSKGTTALTTVDATGVLAEVTSKKMNFFLVRASMIADGRET